MDEPVTVLLVDDHEIVRVGLKAFFGTLPDIHVIGEAACGKAAVDLAADLAPDVVLMDLIMPGMDGVEATRRIKKISPRTQIIVITSFHEDEHIFPAIRAGALSYVLKDISPNALADAVRRARAGEAVLHPLVAARLFQEVQTLGQPGSPAHPVGDLTGREIEVLQKIASGMSNREIAEALFISEKTVKSHVTNILTKLHLAGRTQAAIYAWQEGIMRQP